jgi:hypothetical protein
MTLLSIPEDHEKRRLTLRDVASDALEAWIETSDARFEARRFENRICFPDRFAWGPANELARRFLFCTLSRILAAEHEDNATEFKPELIDPATLGRVTAGRITMVGYGTDGDESPNDVRIYSGGVQECGWTFGHLVADIGNGRHVALLLNPGETPELGASREILPWEEEWRKVVGPCPRRCSGSH